jgi:CspA family cold shock protein
MVERGTVKWFSAIKRFGFVGRPLGMGNDLFVHFSDIKADGYRSLNEGDRVEYAVVDEGPKGPRAIDVVRITNAGEDGSALHRAH